MSQLLIINKLTNSIQLIFIYIYIYIYKTVVLEKTLDSPLDSEEIKSINLKGNQP